MPELNETVGDGSDDGETIPLPGDVSVDSVGTAKDRYWHTFLSILRSIARIGAGAHKSCWLFHRSAHHFEALPDVVQTLARDGDRTVKSGHAVSPFHAPCDLVSSPLIRCAR